MSDGPRLRAGHRRVLIVALTLLSLGSPWACRSRAPSSGSSARESQGAAVPWLTVPEVPSALAPPAGARLVAHFHAAGAQVYACKVSPQGSLAWSLKAPDARLFDATGAEVGSHGAGPSWSVRDGSRATAKKLAQIDAPRANAVPWLLLEVTSTAGNGVLSPATYVQRVGTSRGQAPGDGCLGATLGSEVAIDYAAEYYFYAGGRRPAGPDGGPGSL
jgi:Protein of unknown function (DUF3455)